jgi:hypothetical protein
LLLAAVATGSVTMPLKEPLPSVGMAEQPGPKVSAPASDMASSDMASEGAGALLLVVSLASLSASASSPHAARPIESAITAIPAAPVRRRVETFMGGAFR